MKKRIIIWIVSLIIAFVSIIIYNHFKNLPKPEKKEEVISEKNTLQLYNDVINSDIIMEKFNNTHLSTEYELSLEEKKKNANYLFTNDISLLKSNETISTVAYTPLVIGFKNTKELQNYKKNNLLVSSKEITNTSNDEISINFLKMIDAVVQGDNWSVFGGPDKEIRIYVPKKNTIEGQIFYNLLLVTINNGSYPANEDSLKEAKETADAFLESSNIVETSNVINELTKISSVNITDIYILFEADFINSTIWSQATLDICLAYPEVTLVKHIYTQSKSHEIPSNSLSKFYNELSSGFNYRTSNNYSYAGEKFYNIKDEISFIEVESKVVKENKPLISVIFLCIIVFPVLLAALVSLWVDNEW